MYERRGNKKAQAITSNSPHCVVFFADQTIVVGGLRIVSPYGMTWGRWCLVLADDKLVPCLSNRLRSPWVRDHHSGKLLNHVRSC
jgi:hypothetical protein